MAVQHLITEIYEQVPMAQFEMEYEYEVDPHTIDLRLYGADKNGAETIKEIILEFEFNGVTGATVEVPTQDEIDFGFTGHKFVRVIIEVDRNVARGRHDHYFFNDAGRML